MAWVRKVFSATKPARRQRDWNTVNGAADITVLCTRPIAPRPTARWGDIKAPCATNGAAPRPTAPIQTKGPPPAPERAA